MDAVLNPTLQCLWPLGAELGEGPLWLASQQRLYFVDLKAPAIHAYDPASGARHSWPMPDYVCWLIPCRDGDGFIAGLGQGFVRLWLEPELYIEPLAEPLQDRPGVRLNDAKADAAGRIWAGSMHNTDYSRPEGHLIRLEADGKWQAVDAGYHICNGPALSPDGRTLYHTDSYKAETYAYYLTPGGALGQRRLWRQFDAAREGSPDGMTVDSEGCLWIAQWGGGRVCRYSPAGELLATVHLPVSQPASCTLGGPDLRTLFITSARETLSAEALAREPLAGALFAIEVDIPGLPAASYGA